MKRAPRNLTDQLSKRSKKFFIKIFNAYELESHHLELLAQAAECLDRIDDSRLRIKKDGAYILDRFKNLKPHPGLKEIAQEKITFARLIRELNLDVEPGTGELGRPPGIFK
ncbi:unnamed protein product [marine sediment metagenome]|uniref:Uncharacterized protein n=1 Tax=marine sediment metagenome TaxID=412755 RepID=X1T2S6_9ZZZZ